MTSFEAGASKTPHNISAESYAYLKHWIQKESGILIDDHKDYLLHSRLSPILQTEGIKSFDDLCAWLQVGRPGIRQKVVEAMTTHETLFFRDNAPFAALKNHIIPILLARRTARRPISIWSAASSSGQEAYSVAMLFLEMGLASKDAKILATDLSEQILQRARHGRYGNFEIQRGLPPDLLKRYFHQDGNGWIIDERVRQMVEFNRFDLRDTKAPGPSFDVILCRNVLIYFDPPTKTKVLSSMCSRLSPGGYLMLGAAESVDPAHGLKGKRFGDAIAYYADNSCIGLRP